MIRAKDSKKTIPIYLHSGDHPVQAGLLELLRGQLNDIILVARFPSFVQEIAYDGYGVLLGKELRDIHARTAGVDIQMETHMQQALYSQAELLAALRHGVDRAFAATPAAREEAIAEIRPWMGWLWDNPAGVNLEEELPRVQSKLNEAARDLLDHMRLHLGTSGRGLEDYEARLGADRNRGPRRRG